MSALTLEMLERAVRDIRNAPVTPVPSIIPWCEDCGRECWPKAWNALRSWCAACWAARR